MIDSLLINAPLWQHRMYQGSCLSIFVIRGEVMMSTSILSIIVALVIVQLFWRAVFMVYAILVGESD